MAGWKIQLVPREDYEFIDFVADKVPELQARNMIFWSKDEAKTWMFVSIQY